VIAVAAAASPPLRDALRDEVARRGLAWSRNPFPAEGFFFRSDHYSFLRAGVPGVLLFTGLAFEERPQAWGLERAMVYLKDHYHRTTDDLTQVLDWEGTARYARLWLDLGRALANGPELPASGIDLQVGD
jgi:Zn-dependent M28 family amino/carboxypeptidase